MKGRFAECQVKQGGVVRLDHEEEDLLQRNVEEFRPKHDIGRVAPDVVSNEVGIPRRG